MILRFLLLIIMLFVYESIIAQSDSTSSVRQGPARSGAYIGLELTGFGELYPGIRINHHQFLTSKDFIDASAMYITQERPILNGYEASLHYKRLLIRNIFFAGLGVVYSNSDLDEDIILRRLGGAFFEEVDLSQKRTLLGGVLSFGALFSISEIADIKLDFRFIKGRETYSKIDNIPIGSELEETQEIDRRFIYNLSQDLIKNTNLFDFNLSIMINI